MFETGGDTFSLVLITGGTIVATMLVKGILERTVIPPLIGFLLLGFGLRSLEASWNLLPQGTGEVTHFLSQLGLVTLLFRVGLSSDITMLVKQLKNASLAWVANVLLAGLLGVGVAVWILDQGIIPSLIIGAAFTATSVGVSVKVWQDHGALGTSNGALLIDLAELDDVSAVFLMGLVFALVPILQAGNMHALGPILIQTVALYTLKLLLFGGVCFLCAVFLERPVTTFLDRVEHIPDSTLTIVGLGFVTAAVAAWLGFSLAIGAFFAGLVFSRDPKSLSLRQSFVPIFDFFSPFFFIGIGFELIPGALTSALGWGVILAIAAIAAKLAANSIPLWMTSGRRSALLIGASMVPRAEIALVIMHKGLTLGEPTMPHKLFAAMVVVSAVTCLLSPIAVNVMLTRWPQSRVSRG